MLQWLQPLPAARVVADRVVDKVKDMAKVHRPRRPGVWVAWPATKKTEYAQYYARHGLRALQVCPTPPSFLAAYSLHSFVFLALARLEVL